MMSDVMMLDVMNDANDTRHWSDHHVVDRLVSHPRVGVG